MDKWDEEKLRSVILSKHGNLRTTTEVQCPPLILALPLTYFPLLRFLLDRMQVFYRGCRDTKVRGRGPPLRLSARRSNRDRIFLIPPVSHFSRFGWFWQCPSGESCQYRHALPPGFVLKSQKKAMEEAEKANTISLEEFLEVEVRYNLYKITNDNPRPPCAATQTWIEFDARHARDIRQMEKDANEQEGSRG